MAASFIRTRSEAGSVAVGASKCKMRTGHSYCIKFPASID